MTIHHTQLSRDILDRILAHPQGPRLSLYQPTHRHHPENAPDPILFGNLVKRLGASLTKRSAPDETRALLRPFEALASDDAFWRQTRDGLAVLAAPGLFEVFVLQRSVPELAIVADTFHTKPLRRILQTLDRYQVLGITRQKVRLFEGNRDVLDEVPLHPDVPGTITAALGDELTDPHLTVASYGGVGGGTKDMRHGHGGKKDEIDVDTERFFRVVDRAIWQHHSQPSSLPLVLAGLGEHHAVFRQVSRNNQLVDEGIAINFEAVSPEKLRDLAWAVIEGRTHASVRELVEAFGNARASGRGSEDLAEIAAAVSAGRVATLLVEAERQIPGRFDESTGAIVHAELDDPHVDDLLDELAEAVEKTGGRALVLPAGVMPTQTGAAAIFRY